MGPAEPVGQNRIVLPDRFVGLCYCDVSKQGSRIHGRRSYPDRARLDKQTQNRKDDQQQSRYMDHAERLHDTPPKPPSQRCSQLSHPIEVWIKARVVPSAILDRHDLYHTDMVTWYDQLDVTRHSRGQLGICLQRLRRCRQDPYLFLVETARLPRLLHVCKGWRGLPQPPS